MKNDQFNKQQIIGALNMATIARMHALNNSVWINPYIKSYRMWLEIAKERRLNPLI